MVKIKLIFLLVLLVRSFATMAQDWAVMQQKFRGHIAQGNREKVEQYLLAGADINHKHNQYGGQMETPLVVAIASNQLGMVEFLVEKGANVNLPYNTRNGDVYPIQAAVEKSSYEIISFLLSKGANAYLATEHAKRRGNLSIINLISGKTNTAPQYTVDDLNAAIENTNWQLIEALLASEVSPNAWTLILAARTKNYDFIKKVVAKGANINEQYQNKKGGYWSPICEAINSNDLAMLKFLIEELGVNPSGVCSWTGLGIDTKTYVEWSKEHMYCKCRYNSKKAEEVTEYLLLAPGIIRQKGLAQQKSIQQQQQVQQEQTEMSMQKAEIIKKQGDSLAKAKNYEDAIQAYEKAYETQPDFKYRLAKGQALFMAQNYQEALPIFKECASTAKASFCKPYLAWCEAKTGNSQAGETMLQELATKAENYEEKRKAFYELATFYAFVKNQEKALENLQKAIKNGFKNLSEINENDNWAALRQTEAYQKIIEKIKP